MQTSRSVSFSGQVAKSYLRCHLSSPLLTSARHHLFGFASGLPVASSDKAWGSPVSASSHWILDSTSALRTVVSALAPSSLVSTMVHHPTVPMAPPWSVVDHPPPQDYTPLASPHPSIPPALSGSSFPMAHLRPQSLRLHRVIRNYVFALALQILCVAQALCLLSFVWDSISGIIMRFTYRLQFRIMTGIAPSFSIKRCAIPVSNWALFIKRSSINTLTKLLLANVI